MLLSLQPLLTRLVPSLLALGFLASCGTSSSNSAPTVETEVPASIAADSSVSEPATTTATQADRYLTTAELWQRLQQPEESLYVLLLRHALAPGTGDPADFVLGDCSTQRNLSEEGRSQARAIGQAFRDRGIDVQQVLSSQWCRCLETAELMDLGEVESFPPLNSFFRDRRTAEAQTTEVQKFLRGQAAQPGVLVMVTHQVNITALTDVVPQSGEAVVMEVAADSLTFMGQLRPAL